jgi:hypothetical protein
MTFAREFEAPPRVWGVGRVTRSVAGAGGVEVVPWAVAAADVDDEAAAAAPALAALGLRDGDLVLIVSLLSQAIHVVPLEQAAGRVGALYSSADATPFDAFRTAALIRQLEPRLVLGIDRGVVEGLVEAGRDLREVFEPVPTVVVVDANARERLHDAGVATRGWLKLGPTNVFQGATDDGYTYDPERWRVETDGGELLVTNLVPRLTPAERLPTGIRGRVTEPGRVEADLPLSASGSP